MQKPSPTPPALTSPAHHSPAQPPQPPPLSNSPSPSTPNQAQPLTPSPPAPQTRPGKFCKWLQAHYLTIIIVLAIIGLIWVLSSPLYYKPFRDWLSRNVDILRGYFRDYPFVSNLLMSLIGFATSFVFPSKGVIMILTAFIIKDLWTSIVVCFFPTVLACACAYPLVRLCLYQR